MEAILDFENGKSKWRGDMVVEYETPEKINKICRIDADEEERIEITQKVAIRDPKKLTFKFQGLDQRLTGVEEEAHVIKGILS